MDWKTQLSRLPPRPEAVDHPLEDQASVAWLSSNRKPRLSQGLQSMSGGGEEGGSWHVPQNFKGQEGWQLSLTDTA